MREERGREAAGKATRRVAAGRKKAAARPFAHH